MEQKKVKTPKYWGNKELFGELTEVETVNGNKVMIPKRFIHGWETAVLTYEHMTKRGLDPLDGIENDLETNSLYYDLERVFFEIYEEDE